MTYAPLAVELGDSLALYVQPRIDPATGELIELGYNQVFLDPATGQELGRREWGKAALTRLARPLVLEQERLLVNE